MFVLGSVEVGDNVFASPQPAYSGIWLEKKTRTVCCNEAAGCSRGLANQPSDHLFCAKVKCK